MYEIQIDFADETVIYKGIETYIPNYLAEQFFYMSKEDGSTDLRTEYLINKNDIKKIKIEEVFGLDSLEDGMIEEV